MKRITSRENPRYKALKLLANAAAARRKAKQTLLDGVHLCESYLAHVGMPVTCVCSESGLDHPEVAPILDRCQAAGTDCVLLPDPLYDALSQVEHGVGLTFVVTVPHAAPPGRLDRPSVLLDGIQDPGNLGSILRTAAAAGVEEVLCGTGTVAVWSPKVLRAGMGAHFLLRIAEHVDLATVTRDSAVPLLATSSHAARTLFDVDLTGPVAWLFGNEGRGVAPDLLAQASERVAIPHLGPVESLNVAACAAVCLFEQVRQRLEGRRSVT